MLEPSSAGSDAFLETIRVARETNNLNNNQNNNINNDQETQASEKNQDQQPAAAENSSIDELTLDSIEDDENRGKRFVFMIDERNKGNGLINYESKQIFELWSFICKWTIKRFGWIRKLLI